MLMDRTPTVTGLGDALHTLQAYADETAAAYSDASLADRVMTLFRAEDLEGISKLMIEHKMEREFVDDLEKFIVRWRRRVQSGNPGDAW